MANPNTRAPRDPRFAGATPFSRLAVTHSFSVSGDVFFFLALSGSLFFTVSADAARPRVILALLFTMAPFAIVAPLMGPALDRIRGARSLMITAVGITQFVLCLVTANHLNDLALYPLAFSLLVLGKTYSIAKSSLVPMLVRNHDELVTANSRLSMIGVAAGAIAGVIAATILIVGPEWVLRVGAFIYLASAVLALRIPRSKARRSADEMRAAELEREREELHLPSVVLAGTAMAVMRMGVGFLVLLLAFTFKRNGEPFWVFGAALAVSSIGTFLGAAVAPRLRQKVREEYILVGSLLLPAVAVLVVARFYNSVTALVASLAVGIGASAGKLAFDSVLQRDAPDAIRGRTFARMETKFQILWVIGSLLAVVFVPSPQLGFLTLSLVLGFAGLSYLSGLRKGRDRPGTPRKPSVVARLQRWRQGRAERASHSGHGTEVERPR